MKKMCCSSLFAKENSIFYEQVIYIFNSYAAWSNIIMYVQSNPSCRSSLKRNLFLQFADYVDHDITGVIFNLARDIGIFFVFKKSVLE